jgi:predicted MFS family arabinose efflux permease
MTQAHAQSSLEIREQCTDRSEPQADDSATAGTSRSWYALALLASIAAFSLLDRQLPFVMAEAIKQDLALSDGQLGLVGGLAFSLFYTVLCLPMASLADRYSRKWVITTAVAVWSAMTALSGLARNMSHLFLARIGVAFGEAGSVGPSHSMIADYFPPGRRATAMSLYSIGGTVGVLVGFSLGGWLSDQIGWRMTYLTFGAPGLLLAVLAALTLRDPVRVHVSAPTTGGMGRVALKLLRTSTYRNLCIAASFHGSSATAIMAWLAPFFIRSHELTTAQAGLAVGFLSGAVGSLNVLLGGLVADKLAKRDRRWQLWVPAIGVILGIPLYLCGLLAAPVGLSFAALIAATLIGSSFAGPVFATVQDLADPRDRATASALIVLVVSLVGGAGGPAIAGFVSDALRPVQDHDSLRTALCMVMLLGHVGAAIFFMRAASTIRNDLGAARAAP